ncbi:hypothetical protein [Oceanospirillum sediminis]|uniref:Chalcone isomerase domain-containing protein n=1 Tax=Oceanospirillum sediminis TaxID=2760088 RepID=A0A839IV96_9GAMM|nr:hypothetical protein [Oceanospirillum sediminis]MBB1488632.1 hypothetical protein [Oceanospirillum sediminis]
MKILPLILLASSFSVMVSAAEPFPEPFGLNWGMTESQLKKSGFKSASPAGKFNVLTSVSTPKAWSRADTYMAVTYRKKLVKVIAHSRAFTSDIYGRDGKALYNQVKSLLIQKYGEPKRSHERTGLALYDDADEFYQCLKYSGCGNYISLFEYQNGYISVQLEGTGRGKGYLSVAYESPAFYAAKNTIEQSNNQSDTEAF